eukprot:359815-Rhodomonas_salina.1
MKTEEVKQKEETSPPLISTVQTPQQPYVTGGKQMQSLAKMKVEKPIPVLTALPLKKEIPPLAPVQRNIPPPAPAKKDIPLPLAPKKVFHEPTCENGHRLAFKGKNDTQWACNGRETEEGCRRGCTDFGQSSTWDCWRCDACDFDLCDQCFAVSFPRAQNFADVGLGAHVAVLAGSSVFRLANCARTDCGIGSRAQQ